MTEGAFENVHLFQNLASSCTSSPAIIFFQEHLKVVFNGISCLRINFTAQNSVQDTPTPARHRDISPTTSSAVTTLETLAFVIGSRGSQPQHPGYWLLGCSGPCRIPAACLASAHQTSVTSAHPSYDNHKRLHMWPKLPRRDNVICNLVKDGF